MAVHTADFWDVRAKEEQREDGQGHIDWCANTSPPCLPPGWLCPYSCGTMQLQPQVQPLEWTTAARTASCDSTTSLHAEPPVAAQPAAPLPAPSPVYCRKPPPCHILPPMLPNNNRYCSYETLMPIIKPLMEKPRFSALILGSGLSTFPEELYDK